MKSPFPGMDPYLERHWSDVHSRLILYSCDALQSLLPDDLRASVDERLVVESGEIRLRRIEPDVAITAPEAWSAPAFGASGGGVATSEPLLIEFDELEVTEGFIEIRNDTGKLVTAIEFLSPTNKLGGDGGEKYRQKQREVIGARANLIEIDLVRAGKYVLAAPEEKVPAVMRRDYLACVTLSDLSNRRYEMYPLPLRLRLPSLPIPLRRNEPRIPLDLQALLDHAYDAGRYSRLLDYEQPPSIPLEPEDAAWAETVTRKLPA